MLYTISTHSVQNKVQAIHITSGVNYKAFLNSADDQYYGELKEKDLAILTLKEKYKRDILIRDIIICSFMGIILAGFIFNRKQKQRFSRRIRYMRRLIKWYNQSLRHKSLIIETKNQELFNLKASFSVVEDERLERSNRLLRLNILTEEDWINFKNAFEEIYPLFFDKLSQHYPDLTDSELRLSAIIKLKLSLKASASMLGISPESVKKSRYRLRRKFHLATGEDLEKFIEATFIQIQSSSSEHIDEYKQGSQIKRLPHNL